MRNLIGFSLVLNLFFAWPLRPTAWAAPKVSPSQKMLSPSQKEKVRSDLQFMLDASELLVKNRKADLKDIERQKRDFDEMKVYERIPLEPRLDELKAELRAGSERLGLRIVSVERIGSDKKPDSVPRRIFFDTREFKFDNRQIAESILLKVRIEGPREALDTWTGSWRDAQMRYVELDPANKPQIIQSGAKGAPRWELRALTYRFRPLEFPEIRFRDPARVLPIWARKDPAAFAKAEPQLAAQLDKIREGWKQAAPFADDRRPFLRDQARFDFYLSKVMARPGEKPSAKHSH